MKKTAAALAALIIPLAPLLAAAPAAAGEKKSPSWGLHLRGGYYGLPDFIADELFARHPPIRGWMYGAELRYHGTGGPLGIASLGVGFDYGTAEADGEWQKHEDGSPTRSAGEVTLAAFTVTGYWNLFPSWFLHPYVGLGLGAGYLDGSYSEEGEKVTVESWVPVLHVPVGLAVEFGERLSLSAEARFIDGVALGGSLQVRF